MCLSVYSKTHLKLFNRSNDSLLKAYILACFAASMLYSPLSIANENDLMLRIKALEQRVTILEQQLGEPQTHARWKDHILWQRIKKGMSTQEIKKLLGEPGRIEETIFTTWYYHPSSKLHSFVWFDEGVVLGWKTP